MQPSAFVGKMTKKKIVLQFCSTETAGLCLEKYNKKVMF